MAVDLSAGIVDNSKLTSQKIGKETISFVSETAFTVGGMVVGGIAVPFLTEKLKGKTPDYVDGVIILICFGLSLKLKGWAEKILIGIASGAMLNMYIRMKGKRSETETGSTNGSEYSSGGFV